MIIKIIIYIYIYVYLCVINDNVNIKDLINKSMDMGNQRNIGDFSLAIDWGFFHVKHGDLMLCIPHDVGWMVSAHNQHSFYGWIFLGGFPLFPSLPSCLRRGTRLPGNLPVCRSFASVAAWSAGQNSYWGSLSTNWGPWSSHYCHYLWGSSKRLLDVLQLGKHWGSCLNSFEGDTLHHLFLGTNHTQQNLQYLILGMFEVAPN